MPINDDQFREYLKNPIMFPPAFKDWVADWYATNVPKLHVSQIFGFKLHSVYVADDVPGASTPAATAYGDLAAVGPTIDNLSNGFYVVMWGCYAFHANSANNETWMGISVDGSTPSGQLEMLLSGSELAFSVGRLALVDLAQGDNTHQLQAKYKITSGHTGAEVSLRWLHALRVVTEDG